MSYREENGRVLLDVSRENYETILFALGSLAADRLTNKLSIDQVLDAVNQVNCGNPGLHPLQAGRRANRSPCSVARPTL